MTQRETMSNPSKQKGTRAETKVVRYLQGLGYGAKRQPLSGNKDKGDIEIYIDTTRATVEVKAGKMTANPNKSQLKEWMRQAKVEAKNNETTLWILVVVRYNRKLEDADVYYGLTNKSDDVSISTHTWLGDLP